MHNIAFRRLAEDTNLGDAPPAFDVTPYIHRVSDQKPRTSLSSRTVFHDSHANNLEQLKARKKTLRANMAHHEQQPIEAPSANRTVDLHNHQSMTNGSSRSATHNPVHLRTPSGGNSHHRQTFSESLRGIPPSPRGQRHPSFSQNALHELINNPPVLHNGGAKFAGRDWRTITVDEITDPEEVRFVEQTTSIEDATKVGIPQLKRSTRRQIARQELRDIAGFCRDNHNRKFNFCFTSLTNI